MFLDEFVCHWKIKIDGDTGNYGGMWLAGEWSAGQQGRIGFYASSTSNKGVALVGGTGTTPHLYINSSGFCGVGTLSPAVKMEVDTPDATEAFRVSSDGSAWFKLFKGQSGHGGQLSLEREGGSVNTALNSSPSFSSYINAQGGNLGIGVTSPAEKLHVDGNVKVTGVITGQYIETFIHNFLDDLGSGQTHYLPWSGTRELTTANSDGSAYLAPFPMTLVKILIRPETLTSALGKWTVQLQRSGQGTATLSDLASGQSPNLVSDSLREITSWSGSQNVNAGDKISLKLTTNIDMSGSIDWYVTSVWKVTKTI